MKTVKPMNLLLSGVVLFSAAAYAAPGHQDRWERHYEPARHVKRARHDAGNWVIPLVVGGVIAYALSEPRREQVTYVSTERQPVIYSSEPLYEERWIYDANCGCERRVLVRVR